MFDQVTTQVRSTSRPPLLAILVCLSRHALHLLTYLIHSVYSFLPPDNVVGFYFAPLIDCQFLPDWRFIQWRFLRRLLHAQWQCKNTRCRSHWRYTCQGRGSHLLTAAMLGVKYKISFQLTLQLLLFLTRYIISIQLHWLLNTRHVILT